MMKRTEFAGRMEKPGLGQHSSEFSFRDALACPPRHNSATRSLHNFGHLTILMKGVLG